MENDEKIGEKDVVGKNDSTNSVAVSEQDAILAFLNERERVYNELDETRAKLEAEEAKRKKLRVEWKERKGKLNDQKRQKEAIMIMAGQVVDPEQENKNRYHYATQALFYILSLGFQNDEKFKAIYSTYNPIKDVCRAIMDSASYDNDHTICIDVRKFKRIVFEKKEAQDNAKKTASVRLDVEWKRRVSENPSIREVDERLEKGRKLSGNLKKKG